VAQKLEDDGYKYGLTDASFVRYAVPGTTPVETYYNPVTLAYLTAARPEDKASALDHGFEWVNVEGFLFDAPYAPTDVLPFSLFRFGDDYLTTAVAIENVLGFGFHLVRLQGYGFGTP